MRRQARSPSENLEQCGHCHPHRDRAGAEAREGTQGWCHRWPPLADASRCGLPLPNRARSFRGAIAAAILLVAAPAAADGAPDGGAGNAGNAGNADDGGAPLVTCVEHLSEGARRPTMKESLSPRGVSGYAAELRVVIVHGKGEVVLPDGFRLQSGSDAAAALLKAGFVIPDPSGGVAPKVTVAPGEGGTSVTTVTLPVVPLPPKPGRNLLELPPLPIAISRASNDFVTLCTAPHPILVEDPIANELDPRIKPNPAGRPQREDWPLARDLAIGVPIGLALVALGALAYRWWARRPKVVKAPPRIPPWVSALEELDRIRRSSLLEEGKRGEHFDRVSDAVRRYLGARYGLETVGLGANGLETTTGEMLDLLKRVRPPIGELPRIKDFLDDCDLVKVARFTPTEEHCLDALASGETIVRKTIPVLQLPSATDGAPVTRHPEASS